jgi:hypothetical protein
LDVGLSDCPFADELLRKKLGTLKTECDGDGEGVVGVVGDLSEECRGGDGGLVEDECLPFLNNRDTEAVA